MHRIQFALWLPLLCCAGQNSGDTAESQLRLEVDSIEAAAAGGYNVFEREEYAATIQFKLRLIGDPCPFFVTFGSNGLGEGRRQAASGQDAIEYDIYDSIERRTALKELPAADASELIAGEFTPGETLKELSYAIIIPPRQLKRAGRYTDLIKITAYAGTRDAFMEKDSRMITFSIPVEEVTELALVNSGAPFSLGANAQKLDFARLDAGKSRAFDVRVRSNSGYRILLESENGGVMRNTDPRTPATIRYSVHVGGHAVDLANGRQTGLSRSNRLTDHNGEHHELEITIGDTSGAVAGTYRDNIAVTVISDK